MSRSHDQPSQKMEAERPDLGRTDHGRINSDYTPDQAVIFGNWLGPTQNVMCRGGDSQRAAAQATASSGRSAGRGGTVHPMFLRARDRVLPPVAACDLVACRNIGSAQVPRWNNCLVLRGCATAPPHAVVRQPGRQSSTCKPPGLAPRCDPAPSRYWCGWIFLTNVTVVLPGLAAAAALVPASGAAQ